MGLKDSEMKVVSLCSSGNKSLRISSGCVNTYSTRERRNVYGAGLIYASNCFLPTSVNLRSVITMSSYAS